MGKIGWGEFLVIVVIAAIVIGPDKLPELGKALGKAVRSVKKYVNEAASEIADVEEINDIRKDVESIQKDVQNLGKNLEKSVTEAGEAAAKALEEDDSAKLAASDEKTEALEMNPATPEKTPSAAPEDAAVKAEENAENSEIHV